MSTTQKPQSTLQQLSKSLEITETELLITIRQMGLNPIEADLTWKDAIAQHITGQKPVSLGGTHPEHESDTASDTTSDTPESFSIEDSEDFVEWDEVISELGDESTALALVSELDLNQDAISKSDLAALKELALTNPVAEDMISHISAVGGLSGGLVDEYLRQQRDNAQALADAGNIEFAKTLLQGQIEGINQVVGLQNLLASDFQSLIQEKIETLGKRGKERPDELIKELGKKAVIATQSSEKVSKIRTQKLDLVGLKKKAAAQK